MNITPKHITLMLAGMLRSVAMCETFSRDLEPVNIKEAGGSLEHAFVFLVIKNYFAEHKVPPDTAVIRLRFEEYAKQSTADVESFNTIVEALDKTLPVLTSNSDPLIREVFSTIASEYVFKPQKEAILKEGLATASISDISKKLDLLCSKQQATKGGLAESGVLSKVVKDSGDRLLTGIPWLDSRLGGGRGPVRGCGIGIFAGGGVGKTALGIQIAISQAMMGKDSALVLAEEGVSKPLQRRMQACTLGIPTPMIEECNDNLEEAIAKAGLDRNLSLDKISMVDKYLHVIDLVNGNSTASLGAVKGELENLAANRAVPTYVYVDWAGLIADRMLHDKEYKFDDKHMALAHLAEEMSLTAARMNNVIAVAQQMAADAFKKGPFHDNDHYCAADNRSISNTFQYVFVINPKCPKTDVQRFKIAKARHDMTNQVVLVKLRGELGRFDDVTKQYKAAAKRYVDLRNLNDENAVPKGE
jgi:hypothetical protein